METNKKMIFRHAQGGGPCSGKTTGMAYTVDHAKSLGFNVVIIPEAATMSFLSGIPRDEKTQEFILDLQIQNEEHFQKVAQHLHTSTNRPVLILIDRGLLDGMAYVDDKKSFEKLLRSRKLSVSEILETRYDSVTHLVTAANGARQFFTTENNQAREETPEEAVKIDNKLQNVWVGHEHYEIIANVFIDSSPKTFEQKMKENVKALFTAIGYPVPVERELKWIVKKDEAFEKILKNVHVHRCGIVQTYLVSGNPEVEERVRMKTYNDGSTFYYHTTKREIGGRLNQRIEKQSLIDEEAYRNFLIRLDRSKKTIMKDRASFIYEDQLFTLDNYVHKDVPYYKLELEGSQIDSHKLPDFLDIQEEVTDDPKYKDSFLAGQKK